MQVNIEEVYGVTFEISAYTANPKEMGGYDFHVVQHSLKEGGRDIPVTAENKHEFVSRYVRW